MSLTTLNRIVREATDFCDTKRERDNNGKKKSAKLPAWSEDELNKIKAGASADSFPNRSISSVQRKRSELRSQGFKIFVS